MSIDYYDLGHSAGQRGRQPDPQHTDQPYYMQGYNNGAADYRRYRELIEDGRSQHAARVMAGMADPHF